MSVVQLVPQAVPTHTYEPHEVALATMQLPEPSHDWPVCQPLLQVVAPHAVPCGCSAQAPAPLHVPMVLQVVDAVLAHSFCGSVALAIGPHTPLFPEPLIAALQAVHGPVHAVSQQKPSTQLPEAHCVPVVHAAPLAWSGWQVLSLLQ